MVVFEETGGNPEKIEIMTVNRDTICSVITEYHPPLVKSWERKNNQFRTIGNPIKAAYLTCPDKKIIEKIEFVGFGHTEGACGAFQPGKCSSSKAFKVVEQVQPTSLNTVFSYFISSIYTMLYTADEMKHNNQHIIFNIGLLLRLFFLSPQNC